LKELDYLTSYASPLTIYSAEVPLAIS
jgi:hypothetical protein